MTSQPTVTVAAARQNQWIILGLAVAAVTASLLFECSEGHRLRLPVVEVEIPGVCMWQRLTGVDCPGCGLSRCFVSLGHGDAAAAVRYHPLGVVLFALVVVQLPYRAVQLARIARGREPWTHPALSAGLWLLLAALILQWLLKISGVWGV